MPLPPSRQQVIAGITVDARNRLDARDLGAAAPGRDGSPNAFARGSSASNPFASFYERRRKLGGAAPASADSASSITRAYIVPESLLALARGDGKPAPVATREMSATAKRSLETICGQVATESLGMFRTERALNTGRSLQWRELQRVASRLAAWLRQCRQNARPS